MKHQTRRLILASGIVSVLSIVLGSCSSDDVKNFKPVNVTVKIPKEITIKHEVSLTIKDRACPPKPGRLAKQQLNSIDWSKAPYALGYLEAIGDHRERNGC